MILLMIQMGEIIFDIHNNLRPLKRKTSDFEGEGEFRARFHRFIIKNNKPKIYCLPHLAGVFIPYNVNLLLMSLEL